MCTKRCFSSPAKARRQNRRIGNRIRVYMCRECRAWHVTSKNHYNSKATHT